PMPPPGPETAPQPKGEIAPMPPPAAAPQKTATILLAEDTPTNVVTLMDYLDYLGYRLLFAEDGLAAVKIAAAQQPDLILMDIQMPRKNGLEAIAEIRQIPALQHVPIVALTALAMPGDEVRCLRVGADAYLTKPVHLKTLGATIARLLTTPPYPDAPSDDRMLE
ncbi:MAG: response regulator, partial [Cyanobacteria bacterium]|nr:response regulator [Cyanobacteriota bacterium]